ncbi:MAG: ATP-binding protein [Acidobacteriaceae bacterium]|jgi:signal transduction histidine kinase
MPREATEFESIGPSPAQTSGAPRDMASLVNTFDWATTPLGPAADWPESLKAVVRILLTSRFAMWMGWGPELTFLYNDAYAHMTLGKKHPWALGRPASEVWSEIWADIGPRVERVLQTREASWDEELLLFLERNGYSEETYHTFSYSPLTGSDGEITGLLCVVIEETARVIGERQVMLLRSLAATLGDAVTGQVPLSIKRGLKADERDLPFTLTYLFDESGTRLDLVSSTGVEPGQPVSPQVIELDRKPAKWPIKEVLAKKCAVTIEGLSKRFAGLPVGIWGVAPAKARLIPIARQGQEKPVGILIAALNPYRQLDPGYAGFLDLVAGQIAASFASSRAFEEERERAEALAELDRAKTTFFSNVSHELRTPLTLMLGPLEDALQSGAPPEPASLELLHRNAMRLLKLVNALLDFSRIEAGRLRAAYEATDLSLLTTELSSVFRAAVERAGLKLIVECPALPELVYVDHEMWEKVILNLLSNALKSTFDGEIRVNLRATGAGAELNVTDTGTGISAEDLPRIFDRFSRIESARRRSHEGTGIGLALVRELVEMHGGSIRAESAPGKGTTFTVMVPFGQTHLKHGHIRPSSESLAVAESAAGYVQEALSWLPEQHSVSGTHAHADGHSADSHEAVAVLRPRILLADDNADMREYVGGLLSRHFQVVTAENGKVALEQAIQCRPDLMLTDVMMPEMDGFALLAALRQHPATRTLPVIMLSARVGEEARIEGLKASADDYLTKPFTARELIARVEAHLKMARLRREAFEQEAALTREVKKAQQLALEVLEHTPEAFFLFDKNFHITYMNPAAEEITRSPGELQIGKQLWELYPEVVGSLLESSYRRAMEQRIPVEFEYYFEPRQRWYRHRAFPQLGEGLAVYVQDSTDARKAEQALRRSEQLAAAGRLAVSISHEINNPLEAVTNVLYLARMDDGLTGKARELLTIADKELQRLSHIAARSLKFYRQRTSPISTPLEEVLESVIFFHETRIKTGEIQIERRYRTAPPVLCMPGEVQQVFTNLIGNALDALPAHGRLILAIRPSQRPGVAERVRVTIADSGSGMDKQTLDQLFRPFFTTKGEVGTGLGLWVSKGILENHKADIAVRSKRGFGTVFQLFFPVNSVPNATEAAEAPIELESKRRPD